MKKPLSIRPIHIVIVILLCTITFYILKSRNAGNFIALDRIIDGDTFESSDNIVYRLVGIDTPERGEFGYNEAGKYLASTIKRNCQDAYGEYNQYTPGNRFVKVITTGKGRYGRTLAYVSCNKKSINEIMIKDGYALSYRKYPHKYTNRYNELEAEAKRYNKGFWRHWNQF